MYVCLKRPKINVKEAEDGPFKNGRTILPFSNLWLDFASGDCWKNKKKHEKKPIVWDLDKVIPIEASYNYRAVYFSNICNKDLWCENISNKNHWCFLQGCSWPIFFVVYVPTLGEKCKKMLSLKLPMFWFGLNVKYTF